MDAKNILSYWHSFIERNSKLRESSISNAFQELAGYNLNIGELLTCDHNGMMAAIYAKEVFKDFLYGHSVQMYEILSNPHEVEELRRMWAVFTSMEMQHIERVWAGQMKAFVHQAFGFRRLNIEQDACIKAIRVVVEELHMGSGTRHEELYRCGWEFQPIRKVSPRIHVYHYLGECLMDLEQSPDGGYVCYITDDGSTDGYFGFFLKSNGNLLSINERIDEPYPGAHSDLRRSQWLDPEKHRLFPYAAVKGEGGLANLGFMNLGPNVYLPMLLAINILSKRYEGRIPNMPLTYTDALLPINIAAALGGKAENYKHRTIARAHRELDLDLPLEAVLDGSLSCHYIQTEDGSKPQHNYGYFDNQNQMLVDMYGAGFQFDSASLLKSDYGSSLDARHRPNGEFVGTKERMELLAYYNVRRQLADYMRQRIHDEYVAFGGLQAVQKWWKDALRRHMDVIQTLAVRRFIMGNSGQEASIQLPLPILFAEADDPYAVGVSWDNLLSPDEDTYANVSYLFGFHPESWMEMESLIHEELPKIVIGWQAEGHSPRMNHILTVCDPVDLVGTPFELGQSACALYRADQSHYGDKIGPAAFNFSFAVGYSKQDMNKLLKNYGKE